VTLQALALVLGLVWIAVVAALWQALARLEAVERRDGAIGRAAPGERDGG